MYENIDKMQYSPMIRQYLTIKEKYPDVIVFFRLGDFYEMFFNDALVASRELEIVLTGRDAGTNNDRVPMCGVPYHAVNGYIEKLSAAFPLAVKDGKVDKAALREEVFSNEKKRKTLNALAHPEIRRKIEEITGDAVIEVPLLFESGMTDLFDRVIVVTAGEDARINRIVSTRNISKDLAKNIIKNQTTDDERIKRADYVAINDGTRKDLYEQAKNIIKRIFD